MPTAVVWSLLTVALGLVVFHFAVYPMLVIALARLYRRHAVPRKESVDELPSVSLVIAAYNEEAVIDRKISNSLALDYPRERLQVIVVSDGSDDRTHAIASAYASRGVLAMHSPPRRGKSAALNRGVGAASGDIVLLSDANNDFDPAVVRTLVRHFADPVVGGACGRKCIRPADERESSQGDGLYWRYETAIKTAERALGVMTTADGEIFAVRRALFDPIAAEVINDDAEITFGLVGQGYRIVYEPAAVSTELASSVLEDDYRVKVRMIAGGFQTVRRHWRTLLPPTSAFALAFLAHKLLRWLVPLALLLVLGCTLLLADRPLAAMLLAAQVAFYGVALLGWTSRRRGRLPTWQYVPMYFSLMNIAALVGLRRFLTGDGVTAVWQKASR